MGCGSVCLTRYVAVVGILVSGLCIAPPALTFFTGRDPSTLLIGLNTLQVGLESNTEKYCGIRGGLIYSELVSWRYGTSA